MNILIPNLELPLEERIQLSIYPNGLVVNHSTLDVNNRRKAVALPEDHGRLIDATELEASDAILVGEDAWNMIHNAPTVLEANNGADN